MKVSSTPFETHIRRFIKTTRHMHCTQHCFSCCGFGSLLCWLLRIGPHVNSCGGTDGGSRCLRVLFARDDGYTDSGWAVHYYSLLAAALPPSSSLSGPSLPSVRSYGLMHSLPEASAHSTTDRNDALRGRPVGALAPSGHAHMSNIMRSVMPCVATATCLGRREEMRRHQC